MTQMQLDVLSQVGLDTAYVAGNVWRPASHHVENLSPDAENHLLNLLHDITTAPDMRRAGVVVQGSAGMGKTHLLGWAREQIQRQGGYFFLIDLTSSDDFWSSVALSLVDGFLRPGPGGHPQVRTMLRRLSSHVDLPAPTRSALVGEAPLSRADVDQLIDAVRDYAPRLSTKCQEIVRALALLASDDGNLQYLADAYLLSQAESDTDEFAEWAIQPLQRTAESISLNILEFLSLCGAVVVGVDSIHLAVMSGWNRGVSQAASITLDEVAHGLAVLHDQIRRGLLLVAALPATWEAVRDRLAGQLTGRFDESVTLRGVTSETAARQLVAGRLGQQFHRIGFLPPYSTWPVKPTAFSTSIGASARALLVAVDHHIRECIRTGEVAELEKFNFGTHSLMATRTESAIPDASPDLVKLDRRFSSYRRDADVFSAMSPSTEDVTMPQLLAAGLRAWVAEQGPEASTYSVDPPLAGKPIIHARLRRMLDIDLDIEIDWSFRAIASRDPRAALQRIRMAAVACGLSVPNARHRLFILRNVPWGGGPKMQEAIRAFTEAGGETLTVDDEDLRILTALNQMINEGGPHLGAWIRARRPTQDVAILQHALPAGD
ncbi:hypothetical protein [Amycolatopsis sp. cmx-4-83]|uniref:hypothetical protein n=1 Tax=Amycolatopsis sp. cmx-4-83 TaxID=2790940 RepID=UPI00397BF6A8